MAATVAGTVALTGAADVRVAPPSDNAIAASGRVADTTTVLAMPALAVPPVPKDAGFAPTPPSGAVPASATPGPTGAPVATPLRLSAVTAREGDHVDAGEPLATVDQAQFRAAEKLAEADVAVAKSQVGVLDHAIEETRDKERELLDKRAEVEDALATLRTKRADLVDKRAQARQALGRIEAGLPRLEQGLAKVDAGLEKARSAAATITTKQREVRAGIAKLTAARERLAHARGQLRRALEAAASGPAPGSDPRPRRPAAPLPPNSGADEPTPPSDDARHRDTQRALPQNDDTEHHDNEHHDTGRHDSRSGATPTREPTSERPTPDATTREALADPRRHDKGDEARPRGRSSSAPSRARARRYPTARPSPRELQAKIAELDRRIAALDAQLTKARQADRMLTTKRREVGSKLAQAENARRSLIAKRAQARAARAKLTAGVAAMTDGLRRIDEGIAKAEDGLAKIDEGIDKIREARRKLRHAREQARIAVDSATVRRRQATLTRERTTLVAPVSGRVTHTADVGDVLSPGAPVTRISADVDRDHPVLTAWLPPQQAEAVCRNTTASVTADWLSSALPGRVTLLGTRAEYPPTSQATDEVHLLRAVAVEVTVDDLGGAVLPPGTPVGLRLTPCGGATPTTPSGAPASAPSKR